MRQKANQLLLELMGIILKNSPDLRFSQILWVVGIIHSEENGKIIDPFYEEPYEALKRCDYWIDRYLSEKIGTDEALDLLKRIHEII